MSILEIKDLKASIEGKQVLKGVNLTVKQGEVHAIMGPNGSGKSTLSLVLMGHPKYVVEGGSITLDGVDVLSLKTDERAKLGLFLGFQYPVEVPGVQLNTFLRNIDQKFNPENKTGLLKFKAQLSSNLKELGWQDEIANRYLNEGFSGGEKKKSEILQALTVKPKFCILDEPDSGLDIDALKSVAKGVSELTNAGRIIITHYQRILDYIKPDKIHVMIDGKLVLTGDHTLAKELEAKGYGWIKES
ncbi:putative branched-chain amino acid transport ATP-binding protein LivG [uncultured archaeon]|nr:putative branched-chain amino acid transport ATP-binding protein LivG [uncultured archaeon]